jgi:phosphate starvation-inducible protein PhoH
LDSIITRLGKNSKFIMAGDYYQTDLKKSHDKNGFLDFLNILENVDYFTRFTFAHKDIVRSELVKSYIIAKENYQKP